MEVANHKTEHEKRLSAGWAEGGKDQEAARPDAFGVRRPCIIVDKHSNSKAITRSHQAVRHLLQELRGSFTAVPRFDVVRIILQVPWDPAFA